jgi:hypothetical protein
MSQKTRLLFKFYRSYFDVACELSDKDRLAFYDAIMQKEFLGIEPNLKGSARLAYISQKHSIDAQVKGWEDYFKTQLSNNQDIENPIIPPMIPPMIQEEEKEKEKNKEKEYLSFLQKDFIPIVEKWLIYKKEKKQEYKGQTSINTFCKKLIEYSNGDAIIAEAIIEQSIANNWAGIFELKINGVTKKQNDNVYE